MSISTPAVFSGLKALDFCRATQQLTTALQWWGKRGRSFWWPRSQCRAGAKRSLHMLLFISQRLQSMRMRIVVLDILHHLWKYWSLGLSTDIRIRTDVDFFRKNPWKSTKKTNQTQQTPSVSRQRKTETLSGLASSEVDFIVKAQRKEVATVKGIPRWSPPCCQAVKNNPNLRGSLGKAHRRISADLSWWS